MNNSTHLLITCIITLSLVSCKMASLLPDEYDGTYPDSSQSEEAIDLLNKVVLSNNLTVLNNAETYTFIGKDNWKTLLAFMNQDATPDETSLKFRLRPHTFDGQVWVYNKTESKTVKKLGMQSWHPYKIKDNNEVDYSIPEGDRKLIQFGMPNYHFVIELASRILKAPTLVHLGRKTLFEKEYETIFATWNSPYEHIHDDYLIYIDPVNYRIEAATFTVKEGYPPFTKNIYATYRFQEFKQTNQGITIPTEIYAMVGDGHINTGKALHNFTIEVESFDINSFPLKEILINPLIKDVGDAKPF